MTDHIEPALDEGEWEDLYFQGMPSTVREAGPRAVHVSLGRATSEIFAREIDVSSKQFPLPESAYTADCAVTIPLECFPGLIALANDALHDTDPRKITRAKLRRIRQFMGVHEDEEMEFLDALESYLPPVNTPQDINAELQANPTRFSTSG